MMVYADGLGQWEVFDWGKWNCMKRGAGITEAGLEDYNRLVVVIERIRLFFLEYRDRTRIEVSRSC